jgi:DNA-binding transcriptional MerR regulator
MANSQPLTLTELCSLAGVTERTVRYYIAQDLLPSPGSGKNTRYGLGHLARLRLIRRLQEEYLPLAEIRTRLERLTEAEILADLDRPIATPNSRGDSSAAEYVLQLLGHPSSPGRNGMLPSQSASLPALPISAPNPSPPSADLKEGPEQTGGEPGSRRSTWERIGLCPDVELHIRRPLTRAANRQVEALIQLARNLFKEEHS